MEQKKINEVAASLRQRFQKAQETIRKNGTDYAIDQLKSILKVEPGFTEARNALREQERIKTEKVGALARIINNVSSSFAVGKIKKLAKSAPKEALATAEDILSKNLNNPTILKALSDTAVSMKADFIAVEALEIIREYHPKNETNLRELANIYKRLKEGVKVLSIFQDIAELHPNDLNVEGELRAAAALASMEKGSWEKEQSFADKIQVSEDNIEGQGDRVLRNEDDIKAMIEKLAERTAELEDASLDDLRKLGELYYKINEHENAIQTYFKLSEKMGVMDPAIDRAIEKSQVAIYDKIIAEQQEAGADNETVQDLVNQRFTYRLERAQKRVEDYPNDSNLRYNLALLYWEVSAYDEALEQFQMAAKAHSIKNSALLYMGKCFIEKGQYDLAIDQIRRVVEAIPTFGKDKLDALYNLAKAHELNDQKEEALKLYKEIYQHNVKYEDVANKIALLG
ncbi:tetratricopeptide repeat protein [Lentisphaerota bacterium WC36G]|nr:tetratricopeptide repeat protein [Lentisphaerae bacterium WC36]